ncbi:esterase/lipase family protein [Streptomyces sp. NPDC056452]|uniref:esterase/lipase family protein n=1 Tax=Streptomyces sp. NPDC056452 TaxID=3345821 RepID=UPI00367413FF
MSKPVTSIWGALPGAQPASAQEPTWDTTWPLRGGTAWVYYSESGQRHVKRPVILADGFSMGASKPEELYEGLENGQFPFITELRNNGFDVVLLGFDERSASILDNADVAIECIRRTIADREGDAKLTVGGFSMGGLVTRYALAKMERHREQHETGTYLSYDTPHRGAWLPIGVQSFAHFVKKHWGSAPIIGDLVSLYSDLVNSPAARQLLRWHVETGTDITLDVAAGQDQARTDFLDALDRMGNWPQIPRLLGVANGTGTGIGNSIPAGEPAMTSSGPQLNGTQLNTQTSGNQTVAQIHKKNGDPVTVTTTNFPAIDGAPGGLFPEAALEGHPANFGMAAMLAKLVDGRKADLVYNASTFVPTISAVAAGDIDDHEMLYGKIDADYSDLHSFKCASTNEGHTVMTEELGQWILDKLKEE